jgi:hypothetical protein
MPTLAPSAEPPALADAVLGSLSPRERERRRVRRQLRGLPPHERKFLRLRYGLGGGKPWSLTDLAEHFGTTPEGARRTEVRLLRVLREPPKSRAWVRWLPAQAPRRDRRLAGRRRPGHRRTRTTATRGDPGDPDLPPRPPLPEGVAA